MWEHTVHRMACRGRCCIVRRLVKFRKEFPQRECHRVTEEEHPDKRQNDIAGKRIARAEMSKSLHALISDKENDRIHRDEQTEQRRDNARHPADECLTALVEHPDEALCEKNECVHAFVSFHMEK